MLLFYTNLFLERLHQHIKLIFTQYVNHLIVLFLFPPFYSFSKKTKPNNYC